MKLFSIFFAIDIVYLFVFRSARAHWYGGDDGGGGGSGSSARRASFVAFFVFYAPALILLRRPLFGATLTLPEIYSSCSVQPTPLRYSLCQLSDGTHVGSHENLTLAMPSLSFSTKETVYSITYWYIQENEN